MNRDEEKQKSEELVSRRDFLKKLAAVTTVGVVSLAFGIKSSPLRPVNAQGQCGSSYTCAGGGGGKCGSSYECTGGGGKCGSSYECTGGGGKCGSSYECAGGGGKCGSSYNCSGT